MLSAVTGRWVPGAPRTEDGVHPFRKSLAELQIGDSVVAGPRTVTQDDIDHFAEFTGDTFYAHTDPEAAAANPFFGGIVAHGYLVVSFAAGLFVSPEPGPVLANYGLENLRFLTPVKPGDALTVTLTAKQITPRIDQRLRRGPLGRRRHQRRRRVGRQVRRADAGGEGAAVTASCDSNNTSSPPSSATSGSSRATGCPRATARR